MPVSAGYTCQRTCATSHFCSVPGAFEQERWGARKKMTPTWTLFQHLYIWSRTGYWTIACSPNLEFTKMELVSDWVGSQTNHQSRGANILEWPSWNEYRSFCNVSRVWCSLVAMPSKGRGIKLSARECHLLLLLGGPVLLSHGSMWEPVHGWNALENR